MTNKTA